MEGLCRWFAVRERVAGAHDAVASSFPLYGRVLLRSDPSLAQTGGAVEELNTAAELTIGSKLPQLRFNILSLVGQNGVLPIYVSESICREKRNGGSALHEFLDLINRRFWELSFQVLRSGPTPQFGSNGKRNEMLVRIMANACGGLDSTTSERSSIEAVGNRFAVTYAFHGVRGGRNNEVLETLLTRALKKKCKVRAKLPVHVEASDSCCCILGGAEFTRQRASKAFALLGNRALIPALMEASITLSPDSEILDFLPVDGYASELKKFVETLEFSLQLQVNFLQLRYAFSWERGKFFGGVLGAEHCRLGWGGLLGDRAEQSMIVHLSPQAIKIYMKKNGRDNELQQQFN